MIKRALISVSNKEGIGQLAKELEGLGIEILSTGGTGDLLKESGVNSKDISELTGFPECLDGRVKTLHPAVHSGILAIRDNKDHQKTLEELGIGTIDLLVINLYPFKETILREDVTEAEAIENIDIGGPTMLRAAAKNHRFVTVITDPADYDRVLKEIKEKGNTSLETRRDLALKVFQHTSHYDSLIADYLNKGRYDYGDTLTLTYEKVQDLRYGENPHQKASFYREIGRRAGSLVEGIQLQGKELSFNNINDTNGALELLKEFEETTVVAVKHTNPCGVACGDNVYQAYCKAFEADPLSIFGGIIASNESIDARTAEKMAEIFLELIVAPDFSQEALDILSRKKNLRLIKLPEISKRTKGALDIKKVAGGLLIQETNNELLDKQDLVTDKKPSQGEMEDLLFAYKVVKHVKSNGIVLAKDKQTLAVGPGQTSRIWALENAIRNTKHDLKGSVLASDAFFPFSDCVEEAAKAGVTAIIQPGGSIKDQDSIEACNEKGIAMVFTGMRHFKH